MLVVEDLQGCDYLGAVEGDHQVLKVWDIVIFVNLEIPEPVKSHNPPKPNHN